MTKMEAYLQEDVGFGDITSDILIKDELGSARITANEEGILAGLEEAAEIFRELDVKTYPMARDGDRVTKGMDVLVVEGPLKKILLGERLALNFLMKMSGIATATNALSKECRKYNPLVKIAATRKTTPGFRVYEKKAVVVGGGDPHRYRLDDAILIKDNHLRVVGSITQAVSKAKSVSFTKKIEVEVETIEQAVEAAKAGADIIMLDNMSVEKVEVASLAVKKLNDRVLIEVSGGLTAENAHRYAKHADILSIGWITHSARAIQFNLEIHSIKAAETAESRGSP
ncbi:MAG: carboxylating nicotinate-nucleotide diphosphorylase [Methanomassiliicoccales archaeon]|jgi:nicotinate-nucleotide pyrophosphorylase (carboxylating)|nr:carboxylating nicotinate-nucleotide diphosphorylase [Methanomassiliicoccales archaeon]